MTRVFVSGCYDIVHAGHLQFFREARALGDHLTVSFASAEVLWLHKHRRSSLPDDHKRALLAGLNMVDEVVIGDGHDEGLDFKEHFLRLRPSVLAVTEDDKYAPLKRDLCALVGARYVVLPKTPPQFSPVSTTQIVKFIRAPEEAPLLADGVRQSYANVQRAEGMAPLPGDPVAAGEMSAVLPTGVKPLAWKYCGGGFGGYAVYLFADQAQRDAACARPNFRAIEPYLAIR